MGFRTAPRGSLKWVTSVGHFGFLNGLFFRGRVFVLSLFLERIDCALIFTNQFLSCPVLPLRFRARGKQTETPENPIAG